MSSLPSVQFTACMLALNPAGPADGQDAGGPGVPGGQEGAGTQVPSEDKAPGLCPPPGGLYIPVIFCLSEGAERKGLAGHLPPGFCLQVDRPEISISPVTHPSARSQV